MNNFSTIFQTFAFSPVLIGDLPNLIGQYGDEAQDGLLTVRTICCGWDTSDCNSFRALRFPETVSLTELTDGRYAYTALWSNALLEALSLGEFPDVQELTQEELQSLLPATPEIVADIPETPAPENTDT